MLKKWKHISDKIFVKETEYDLVLDRICENNRKVILIICTVFTLILSILLVLGVFHIAVSPRDLPAFLFALLCSVGCLCFTKFIPRHQTKPIMVATYFTIAGVLLYGLLVSYRSPDQYTVTFIATMSIMSMTFVDKPVHIGVAYTIATAVCVCFVSAGKEDSIRSGDIINVVSFSLLSIISGCFTMNVKLHGYVMDKMQEHDIEVGRQRLNKIETEALQLLTAVKSAYDMVVSVNLTQNSYVLIGSESFITQGDAITGVFDDVINIHASKVVEDQRHQYYNTFSRQALLDAYSAGKKEVYLEYQQLDDDGVPHWLGTHTMFTTDPHSTDVTEITISQNIDERIRRETENKEILRRERDRAEQAQKAKTDFLFQMSHDIRTPMNAIVGFANFIKSSDDLYTIHNDYVVKLEIASQQLLMLINDALEMSRIESGKLVFHRQITDIRSIIMNVVAVMQIQAEEKGVELSTDLAVHNPIVNCDQNHLSRVIMNLLSNAVKFTHSGGNVSISLAEQPGAPEGYTRFQLKVRDTGIGMAPDFLKKVFEPFEREQTSTVSGMQGTGLGLAIVKRIVETAGDSISVKSKQGVGTEFTIDLCLLSGAPDALSGEQFTVDDLPPMEQMADYFRGKRILLVEDNEFNLTIAHVLLENAGFHVETATDGRIAVNKVAAAPVENYYDVILMDIQMPVMDGYEATRAIRALPDKRAQTQIIAVTANAFDTDQENAFAAGMDGHIAKPIDVAVLYKTLWNHL